ncbi:MAG: DUF3795 domain-containing protein [Endomicrobiales bacterium]|nr:DUF3795 domain-containing protein [Endomicrobiales bacterium]
MSDGVIVARCGLVCTSCGAFTGGKCGGCLSGTQMFRNCPIKRCSEKKKLATCADCGDFKDLNDCGNLNNIISKIIGFFTKSNRIGNLERIRAEGMARFVSKKTAKK